MGDSSRVEEIKARRAKEYGHRFTATEGIRAALADIDYLMGEVERLQNRRILTRGQTPEEIAADSRRPSVGRIRGGCLVMEIVDGDDPRLSRLSKNRDE